MKSSLVTETGSCINHMHLLSASISNTAICNLASSNALDSVRMSGLWYFPRHTSLRGTLTSCNESFFAGRAVNVHYLSDMKHHILSPGFIDDYEFVVSPVEEREQSVLDRQLPAMPVQHHLFKQDDSVPDARALHGSTTANRLGCCHSTCKLLPTDKSKDKATYQPPHEVSVKAYSQSSLSPCAAAKHNLETHTWAQRKETQTCALEERASYIHTVLDILDRASQLDSLSQRQCTPCTTAKMARSRRPKCLAIYAQGRGSTSIKCRDTPYQSTPMTADAVRNASTVYLQRLYLTRYENQEVFNACPRSAGWIQGTSCSLPTSDRSI